MEYKTRVNTAKETSVKQLKDEFSGFDGFIFADYRGLTVSEITELRKNLRAKNSFCRVVKNSYAKIAFNELGYDSITNNLVGPTAVILIKGTDQNPIAKIVVDAQKDTGDKLKVRGGYLDGNAMDASSVEAFAKLQGRLDLISMLMGTMLAPVQKVAATLLAYKEKLENNSGN